MSSRHSVSACALLLGLTCSYVQLQMTASRAMAAEPQRVALLVGVDRYQKPGFSPLKYAEADVKAVGAELKLLGFDVTVLTGSAEEPENQATHDSIRSRLQELLKPLGRDDLFLLMLSGHGQQDAEGDAFYCPLDAVRSDRSTLLSLSEIVDVQLADNVGRKFVIVDACRDDAQLKVRSRGIQGRVTSLPEDTAILFSCRAGQQSLESADLKHGVFSYCLLESLRGATSTGAAVSWHTLVDEVSTHMLSEKIRNVIPQGFEQEPIAAASVGHTVFSRRSMPRPLREQLETAINEVEAKVVSAEQTATGAVASLLLESMHLQILMMRLILVNHSVTPEALLTRCRLLIQGIQKLPEEDVAEGQTSKESLNTSLATYLINYVIGTGMLRGDLAARLLKDLPTTDEYKRQTQDWFSREDFPYQTYRFAAALTQLEQLRSQEVNDQKTILAMGMFLTEASVPLVKWDSALWGPAPEVLVRGILSAATDSDDPQDFVTLSHRLSDAAREDATTWTRVLSTCDALLLMRPGTHFDTVMAMVGDHDFTYSQLPQGVPCLVEFTAEWCPPCRSSLEEIAELQQEFDESRLSVIVVGMAEEKAHTQRLIADTGVKAVFFPTKAEGEEEQEAEEEQNEWLFEAGVTFIPYAILFDEQGQLVASTLLDNLGFVPGVRHEVIEALREIRRNRTEAASPAPPAESEDDSPE